MIYLLPEDTQLDSREAIKKGNKTEEDIKKFTIEQDMGETKRTIFLLSKGEAIQRKAIIETLYKTIKRFPIKEIITELEQELQYLLVQQLIQLVPLLSDEMLTDLTNITLRQLQDWKNQKLSFQWLKLFGLLITKQTFVQLQEPAMKLALKLLDAKQILVMKMVGVRMLGHLSFFMKNRLKGTPLDRIRSFFRDPDKQMRLIIVKQVLPKLFTNLGIQLINIYFMQKIFEIIYDSDQQIKIAAIQLLLQFYNILSVQDKQRFAKIVMQHLEQPIYFEQLSLKSGDIYLKIRFQLERKSDMGSFINCFLSHISSENQIVKYNALYNLPCLLVNMGLKIWSDIKKVYFEILLKDETAKVRQLSISMFHEVMRIMWINDFDDFPNVTLQLIKTLVIQEEDTLYHFFQGFPIVLQMIKRYSFQLQNNQKDNNHIQKIINNIQLEILEIVKLFQQIPQTKNHYLKAKIHSTIGQCSKYMNSQNLIHVYFPILCKSLQQSNGITIDPLLESCCQILYQLISKIQIMNIIEIISKTFYESNSIGRIIFIKLSVKLFNYFSLQKNREMNFFLKCSKLVKDKVLAVKMQLVKYMEIATLYFFEEAQNILNELFQDLQIQHYFQRPPVVQRNLDEIQEMKRKNQQFLKNEEIQFILTSKRKIQQEDLKKKNFIVKTNTKKNIIKHTGTNSKYLPSLTSLTSSNHSLVPSFTPNNNKSQIRGKLNDDLSKSIRKAIQNKPLDIDKGQKHPLQKRKFQSVQISLYKSNIGFNPIKNSETKRRRKTIVQKKDEML